MKAPAASAFLEIIIRDIEPIHGERNLGAIRPGITVVRGGNGTGKTTTKRLIRAATSNSRIKAEDFEIVAGAAKGIVRFAGKTLTIQRGGSASRKGDAPTAEPIPSHIKMLEDPGFVGLEPRQEARLRAICGAFGVEPTVETLRLLLPADEAELAGSSLTVEDLLRPLERVPPDSVPAGAAKLKARLQKERQDLEKRLAEATRQAELETDRHARAREALEVDAGDELAEVTGDLPGRLDAARRELGKLGAQRQAAVHAAAERRAWQEQLDRLAEISSEREHHQGILDRTMARQEAASSAAEAAADEISELRRKLNEAESKRAQQLVTMEQCARDIEQAKRLLAHQDERDRQMQALRQRVAAAAPPAVDDTDVDLAESAVMKLERLIGYRERHSEIAGLDGVAVAAEQLRADLADLVDRVDGIDKAVWRRLGDLLAERLDGAARVVDGRVEVPAPNGEWHDLDDRIFSQGQRAELTLRLMISGAKPEREVRVVVDEDGDCPIDDNGLRRLSPEAAAKGLVIVVEKEEAGAALRLDHMGGEPCT